MEYADDATVVDLCQCHEMLHDDGSLYGVVDVGHQILDAVDDDEVWFDVIDGYGDHFASRLIAHSSEVEGKQTFVEVVISHWKNPL